MDMYAKCGSIEDAWTVFKEMPSRNVVTWNAMVLEHVKCGQGQKALHWNYFNKCNSRVCDLAALLLWEY